MKKPHRLKINTMVAAVLTAALLGGCSLVSIDSKTRYSDASGFFDPRLLDQIQPDETTRDWLRQHFGEPLFVDRDFTNPLVAAQSVQIDTWRFVRHQQKNTRVFLLFSSRKRHEDSEYLHVVLADNKVVKAWRDTLETVDTRRIMGALGYAPVVDVPPASGNVAPEKAAPLAEPGGSVEETDMSGEAPVTSAEEPVVSGEQTPAGVPPAAALEVTDIPSLGPPNLGYSPKPSKAFP